ncbi:MAG TPA: acetoin dehydrogenase dihydrolipoyllysine-residue acetyltransferase subunit [Aestuariivirgaceae bacterium]|jgi:pyruvate dehydrogenase E2 component (dihydrolipoamide acetyltransferase)
MSDTLKAVVMPKWGLAMSEGMLAKWHIAEGAEIKSGQEICDIETSKIANAMESSVTGRVLRRVAQEGTTLPVGALIAVVGEGTTTSGDVDAFINRFEQEFATAAKESSAEEAGSQTIDVGGRKINYLKLGDAAGVPIILVHGFGADLNTWMFNQPQLAQTHTVYAFDLPGHGQSDKLVAEGTVAEFAKATAGFMDALQVARAHLVGQSLGGAIVLQLAAGHPEKVASLTLISSAGLGPDINMPYVEAFIGATGRRDLKPELEKLFADPQLVSRDMINDVLKYKRMDGVDKVLRTIAAGAFAGGKQSAVLREQLAAAKAPVQVIFGAQDQIIPAKHAEGLGGNVKVRIIPQASHMPHMEAAGEVNRLIAELAKP